MAYEFNFPVLQKPGDLRYELSCYPVNYNNSKQVPRKPNELKKMLRDFSCDVIKC